METTASGEIETLIESLGLHSSLRSLVGFRLFVCLFAFFSYTLCQRIAASGPMSPYCEMEMWTMADAPGLLIDIFLIL